MTIMTIQYLYNLNGNFMKKEKAARRQGGVTLASLWQQKNKPQALYSCGFTAWVLLRP